MTTTFTGAATGTLNFASDNDWFSTTLQAGTQYVFNLGNGTVTDPQITIYNSAGQAVYSGAGGGVGGPAQENTQIAFDPTSSGTYYIGASSASGQQTGTFALTMATAPFDFAGNINTTGAITLGTPTNGTISTAGQNDWFKVTLNAGQAYNFSTAGSATGLNPLISVYDSTGKVLQTGNDFENNSGGQVVYTPTASGTYFIGVGGQSGGTGSFILASSAATVDYGDTPATAGAVTVGGTVTGNLTNIQQRDWFGVTLNGGTQYTFSVAGGTLGTNATVALYDANGNNVVSQISGGVNNGAERTFTPGATGKYYIEAGGLLGSTGTFTVGVTAIGSEANGGNTATAGIISTSGAATGTLTTPGDSNWFKTTLTGGTSYAFAMTGTTLQGSQVALYDSTGALVTHYGANGSGTAEIVFTPTATGTYYVGAAGAGANTGAYSITEKVVTPDQIGNVNTHGVVPINSSASGNLATPGQNDWYKVTLTAGTQYIVSASSSAVSDADVTLYNGNGVAIATSGGNQTSYLAATTGTYYVGVASPSEATGAFSISVASTTDTYPPSTATTGIFTSAAGEVASYNAGTLKTANAISDSVADIQANIDGLETVAAAGLLSSITLTDDQISSTPVLTLTQAQFAADHSVLSLLKGSYTLSVQGLSATGVALLENTQNQGFRYTPGANASSSGNQAIEVSSVPTATTVNFGTGYNMVIIDGTHDVSGSNTFSFNVQANGTVTLHDNTTGQNETITGANYLIFNSGAQNPDGSFQSAYFVEGSTNSQITSLYNAAFLRQPDLIGLEYYAGPLAAGKGSLHQDAINFIASPEFQHDYPTSSLAADKGGAHDQAFVTTLYNNVLDRTPSAGELSFYAQELASGVKDRAQLLIDFSASPENQSKITGFLVNANNGAYADSTVLLVPATVLSQVSTTSALNTASMAPVVGAPVTANGITVTPDTTDSSATVTLSASAPSETVYLSQNYANAVVANNNDVIFDHASTNTITVTGNNNLVQIATGGSEAINVLGGTNTQILSFIPGAGAAVHVANTADSSTIQILDGTTTPVANLDFTGNTNFVINVGNVGGGSAAEVAAAANKAYTVSDAANEHVTFMGETSGGNAVFYFFGSTAGAANGIIPASSLAATADLNANNHVDANEITNVVTLLAINTASLHVGDFA